MERQMNDDSRTLSVPGAPAIPGLAFRRFRGEADYPAMVEILDACNAADRLDYVNTVDEVAWVFSHLANCDPHRDMLFAELEKRLEELDPETVKVVMENMQIMDQATAQIREALDKDPRNRGLERMLMASYHKQVKLLRQANNIPSGMER